MPAINVRTHRSLDKDAPAFALFSGSGQSRHTRSSAGFITATLGLRFSVQTAPERTVLILTSLRVEKAAFFICPLLHQCVKLLHTRIIKHLLGNKHGRAAESHYTVMPDLQDTDGACVR
jgi:hypothetical protein